MSNKRVCYFYDPNIRNYQYNPQHPMKPLRVAMTHSLLVNYDLLDHMDIFRPSMASFENLTNFHTNDYVNFLRSVCPENMEEMNDELYKYNVGEDCPVFKGLYDYCCSTSGGSLCAAYKLNTGMTDIAINWSGGLHHAKRNEASGFCYINDIVLGILELLKYHERVMYIDIDVHHGDGVEEAFYVTDRVMTVSFHKYGDYFPGTGVISDCGILKGKNYAVNVPLNDGMDDESYKSIFRPVISKAIEVFRPGVIVLQSGADSLAGDRLGCFNLSHHGHSSCIEFVKTLGIPVLVLGGGGYTIKNVSRAWAYETSVILGVEISDDLPFNEYFEHFGPDYKLSVQTSNMPNKNSKEYLEEIYQTICENLRNVTPAPSVQMIERPPNFVDEESDEEVLWARFKEESGLDVSSGVDDVRQETEQ